MFRPEYAIDNTIYIYIYIYICVCLCVCVCACVSVYTLVGCMSHDESSVQGHGSQKKPVTVRNVHKRQINYSHLFINSRTLDVKWTITYLDNAELKRPLYRCTSWSE